MPIYSLGDIQPQFPEDGDYWVAPGAQVMGDVRMSSGSSIWFNAVLRGDNEPITIGPGSNVQDGCVFHTDPGFPLTLEENVTIGHAAILHGCHVGSGTLIGMGAVVLNGAQIGRNCLIGANALITEGKVIPDGSMVLGQPGKVVRQVDQAAIDNNLRAARHYADNQRRFRREMKELKA